MSARSELEKKIAKKRDEIGDLKRKVRDAEVWIQAIEEALKVLPRDGVNEGEAASILRPGGSAAEARKAILDAGRPLHIDDVLQAMGKLPTRANRTSVSGALAAYVRRDEIFTRPAPNTFGLHELTDESSVEEASGLVDDDDVPF